LLKYLELFTRRYEPGVLEVFLRLPSHTKVDGRVVDVNLAMDPLTALSLAGNVVQFVEFASSVAILAHKLYQSATGSTKDNDELEMLARNFQQLAESEDLRSLAAQTEGVDGVISHADKTLTGSASSAPKSPTN
jgi:hypothetical protein